MNPFHGLGSLVLGSARHDHLVSMLYQRPACFESNPRVASRHDSHLSFSCRCCRGCCDDGWKRLELRQGPVDERNGFETRIGQIG